MSDLMASIGSAQLKKLDKFSTKRQNLASYYDKKLEGLENITFLIVIIKILFLIFILYNLGEGIKRNKFPVIFRRKTNSNRNSL